MQSLDPEDPIVDELVRASASPAPRARRRWAAGVCVACLAIALFGWFLPGMPDVGRLVLAALVVVAAVLLLWLLVMGLWARGRR